MSIYKKKKAAEAAVVDQAVPLNAEADSRQELTDLQEGFRARLKAEEERRRAATDSEFWFAVCFKTREEKEDFLRRWKLMRHGDKYLSGPVVNNVLEKQIKKESST